MEHRLYLTELWYLYGILLTDKQRECMRLSLLEDFSLQEIGEKLGMSRQSVCDSLHRGERMLVSFEEKLRFAAKRLQLTMALNAVWNELPEGQAKNNLRDAAENL